MVVLIRGRVMLSTMDARDVVLLGVHMMALRYTRSVRVWGGAIEGRLGRRRATQSRGEVGTGLDGNGSRQDFCHDDDGRKSDEVAPASNGT